MKSPKRRRNAPKKNRLGPAPPGVVVESVADQVRYVGSPEHKDAPSFAGRPRPRADATICDRGFHDRQAEIEGWWRAAIREERFSAFWEHGFPRYVWHKEGDEVFIARHTGNGQYKGWHLEDESEWPEGLA